MTEIDLAIILFFLLTLADIRSTKRALSIGLQEGWKPTAYAMKAAPSWQIFVLVCTTIAVIIAYQQSADFVIWICAMVRSGVVGWNLAHLRFYT